MRRREFSYLAIGLVIGLLVGAILVSGSDDLRRLLQGTAGASADTDAAYFVVTFPEAREWLLETQSQEPTATLEDDVPVSDLTSALAQIEALATADNFRQELRDLEQPIALFLSEAYEAASGTDVPETTNAGDIPYLACLGMDDDPYNATGPMLHMYLKVPGDQTIQLPETWTALTAPKENDLYWQLLACQPGSNST